MCVTIKIVHWRDGASSMLISRLSHIFSRQSGDLQENHDLSVHNTWLHFSLTQLTYALNLGSCSFLLTVLVLTFTHLTLLISLQSLTDASYSSSKKQYTCHPWYLLP